MPKTPQPSWVPPASRLLVPAEPGWVLIGLVAAVVVDVFLMALFAYYKILGWQGVVGGGVLALPFSIYFGLLEYRKEKRGGV